MAKRDHTSDFTSVSGGIEREAKRLQIQGKLLEPFTRRVFETAGIATGMKILFGMATEQEVGIDTFAERLRAEVLRMQNVIIWPVMIGAWTRKVG